MATISCEYIPTVNTKSKEKIIMAVIPRSLSKPKS